MLRYITLYLAAMPCSHVIHYGYSMHSLLTFHLAHAPTCICGSIVYICNIAVLYPGMMFGRLGPNPVSIQTYQ